jgi:hypothetical protein
MFTNVVTYETKCVGGDIRNIASFMGLGNCSIPMRLENGKRQLFILHAQQNGWISCLFGRGSEIFTNFTALL